MEKFLLWCAGADHRILAQEGCLIERYKYSAIGTTIILTALMAWASGGYALSIAFNSEIVGWIGGGFWSCIIFNLDRFFILSSKRKQNDSNLQFFTTSLLRLSIAVLLSLVVAKPLEVRLFEPEINRQVKINEQKEQRRKQDEQKKTRENSSEWQTINLKKTEITSLKEQTKNANNEWKKATQAVIEEKAGKGLTGKSGPGEVYEDQKKREEDLHSEYTKIEKSNDITINNLKKEITKLEKDIDKNYPPIEEKTDKVSSFLDRIVALEDLGKENPTIAKINWLITLVFIIIEISPVLVKMISVRGSYDSILEQKENQEIHKEYLHNLKEREIQETQAMLFFALKNIKEFELKVDSIKEEYLRLKEISQQKIENTVSRDIQASLETQYNQEIIGFIQLVEEMKDSHKHIVENAVRNVVLLNADDSLFEEMNPNQNGTRRQS